MHCELKLRTSMLLEYCYCWMGSSL